MHFVAELLNFIMGLAVIAGGSLLAGFIVAAGYGFGRDIITDTYGEFPKTTFQVTSGLVFVTIMANVIANG